MRFTARAVVTVQCTVLVIEFTVYSEQCTLNSLQCILDSQRCTLDCLKLTVKNINVYCTVGHYLKKPKRYHGEWSA